MTGNIHQNYNARDVINAPEVKTAILQRSLFRQDNETIQKWLLNHFYRWLISDFPMVQQINSLAEYSLFNKNDDVIPEWLVSKFNTASVSTATLYYIETDHQQILTKEPATLRSECVKKSMKRCFNDARKGGSRVNKIL